MFSEMAFLKRDLGLSKHRCRLLLTMRLTWLLNVKGENVTWYDAGTYAF